MRVVAYEQPSSTMRHSLGGVMRRLPVLLLALVVVGLATACTPLRMHVTVLASDAFGGRDNNTQSSIDAQNYIISRLKGYGATGLNSTATGDDRFRQPFTAGTNIVGIIP